MVTRIIFSFFFLPFFLFSGEFTASVNRNEINIGEGVALTLTLKEASARGIPSIDLLKNSFRIHSQQQASNTVIVNGKASSSVSWKVILIPHQEGRVEIPSIRIETSEGTLSSEPILINVLNASSSSANFESSEIDGVDLIADISNMEPYKNEPVVYTVRLSSRRNLANIQMQKIDVEGAIVEVSEEPRMYEKIIDGMRVVIAEFSYLITPIKPGPLKIPPSVVQGGIPMKRVVHGRSLFDNDPFSIMQGMERFTPFALATEEIVLDVQPAIEGMNSWIPAQSLRIEEIFDESHSIQVGDPFTRSFKIVAEGVKSNQLPSLNDVQVSNNHFKIYADKPELEDEIKNGKIKSVRKEQYTLIAQEPGLLTFPEISISWWDVVKKEKRVALIPSRSMQVLPSLASEPINNIVPSAEDGSAVSETQVVVTQKDPILYMIIIGLIFLLAIAVFFGILLQKKIARLTQAPKNKEEKVVEKPKPKPIKRSVKKEKKEKLPDLNPT